ncbi:hypothetical protein [Rubidibacter lacunae]|uniref:hypothetical protein n=1 Tax=Rubidibacter lacunae TaxID=582514 RepID=UPI0003FAA21C|nr:hypothetical protein [Rubidibacter lacunae]
MLPAAVLTVFDGGLTAARTQIDIDKGAVVLLQHKEQENSAVVSTIVGERVG